MEQFIFYNKDININGRLSADRGLPASCGHPATPPKDPGEQKRGRAIVQDPGDVHRGVPDTILGHGDIEPLGIDILQYYALYLHRHQRYDHLLHALQTPIQTCILSLI